MSEKSQLKWEILESVFIFVIGFFVLVFFLNSHYLRDAFIFSLGMLASLTVERYIHDYRKVK